MDPGELKAFLEPLAESRGASHFGWAELQTPVSFDLYRQWIERGEHGEMSYLAEHLPVKKEPRARYPFARSAFVFAWPYEPHPRGPSPMPSARIAKYALGEDYHHWLKAELTLLIRKLRERWPDAEMEAVTDSAPLMERDLAARAGLGWIGKNTCVIHPKKGSLFLLGEILCSWEGPALASGVHDFCGTCTRCLEVCPTGALLEPRRLDARLCISYWTIESRQVPPEPLREKIGDWFFGCDLCQDVCPWNKKIHAHLSAEQKLPLSVDEEEALCAELLWVLESSSNQIQKRFRGTALARAGAFGLRRNALIVAANRGLIELADAVRRWSEDEKLGELARWALERLNRAETPGSVHS